MNTQEEAQGGEWKGSSRGTNFSVFGELMSIYPNAAYWSNLNLSNGENM